MRYSFCCLWSLVGLCVPLDTAAADDAATLVAYVQQGIFADFGIAVSPFARLSDMGQIDGGELFNKMPEGFRPVLGEKHPEEPPLPRDWAWLRIDSDELTSSESATRLCRLGLLELFRPEYDGCFSPPLRERTELIDRLQKVISESNRGHLVFFNKGLSLRDALAAQGILRQLSVKFDTIVIESLSASERQRLEGALAVLFVERMELIRSDQGEYRLGSLTIGKTWSGQDARGDRGSESKRGEE